MIELKEVLQPEFCQVLITYQMEAVFENLALP